MATSCEKLLSGPLDLRVGDITIAKSGAKNASVGVGPDQNPLRIILAKSPSLTTPFEPKAFDGGDRVSLDLRCTDTLNQAMTKLDEQILNYVTKHKEKYFKKPPSDAELAGFYTPLVKPPSDPKYAPCLRTKMTLGEKPSVKCWQAKTKAALDHQDIDWRGSELGVQVRLKCLWFQSNKSFGATLEVEHVLVKSYDTCCPFEEDENPE